MKRPFAILLACLFAPLLSAQADFPSLEPAFVYETDFPSLSGEDVIRAALAFSLCPPDSAQGAAALAAYRALESEVRSESFLSLPETERAEQILTRMYARTLTQYEADQSRIDTMLADGRYNCVSSGVLYFALAKAAGIAVAGQETPDHAFCTVTVGGRRIDVETTNPGGFNPGTKKAVEQTSRGTRYFVVPKKYYAGRKEVGERKFVSLVGRNLVAAMNEQDDYVRGVPFSAARMAFVRGAGAKDEEDVRADFDTVAANYAVVLDQRYGQSERALAWLDAVRARWGDSAALRKACDVAAYNCAVVLVQAGEFARAEAMLDAHRAVLSVKNAAAMGTMMFTARIDAAIRSLPPDEAIAFLHDERKNPRAKDGEAAAYLDEREAYLWYQRLRPLFDAGDYLAAAALADEGLASVPGSRSLKAVRDQCYQNYAVDVHNAFARLANAGRYEEAAAVVQDGLSVVSGNTTLKNDFRRIRQLLQNR